MHLPVTLNKHDLLFYRIIKQLALMKLIIKPRVGNFQPCFVQNKSQTANFDFESQEKKKVRFIYNEWLRVWWRLLFSEKGPNCVKSPISLTFRHIHQVSNRKLIFIHKKLGVPYFLNPVYFPVYYLNTQ